MREEDAATAKKYFDKAVVTNIELHIGNAKEIIPALKEQWDLVFIDADKVSYIDYYELTLPAVKQGGYILSDNVFFHGEVLEKEIKGKNAKAIQAFNEHVAKDTKVESVLLTVRDGLLLTKKL
ncbi:MAG: class I SAM-dependent methyltransferase [Ferruginibacter sp.]